MHWTNKHQHSDYYDESGMRIFYTKSMREHDAGTLWLGQMFFEIPPETPETDVQGVCTSECTSKIFTDNLNIFGATNHMHILGEYNCRQNDDFITDRFGIEYLVNIYMFFFQKHLIMYRQVSEGRLSISGVGSAWES